MVIPKFPKVPELTNEQIKQITKVTFYEEVAPATCDTIFVFGGSHPGNWQKPLEAYHKGLGKRLIVTGGTSSTGMKHKEWQSGIKSEAAFIVENLIKFGVPDSHIVSEQTSKSSIENVKEALKIVNFSTMHRLLFVCENYGTGRQMRVLKKYLPAKIELIPYPFASCFDNEPLLTQSSWMKTDKNKSLVFGEYLRNVVYGRLGVIESPKETAKGLETYEAYYFEKMIRR